MGHAKVSPTEDLKTSRRERKNLNLLTTLSPLRNPLRLVNFS